MEELAQTAKAAAKQALAVSTDVRDPASVEALFAQSGKTFGRLDVLFNNAGINAPAVTMDELPLENWKNVIDTNVTGVYPCARAAFGMMKKQSPQGGRIINNGSISAHTTRPLNGPYTASKHAVLGLTKAIAPVVNPAVKAQSVSEFIALAKKDPGKLNFGSGSSSARVASELFMHMSGTKLNYVPYKANPPAVKDLVAGQTDLMMVDLTTSLPQVKAGKLRALGVSSPQRSRLVPDVPTIAEAGVPGYEMHHWNALYAHTRPPGRTMSSALPANQLWMLNRL
ncbi:MAG: tripartite tricarboxylate transporter substrate-binding protein [Burkholderiales bacterium]